MCVAGELCTCRKSDNKERILGLPDQMQDAQLNQISDAQ